MRTDTKNIKNTKSIGVSYLRLSDEDTQTNESSSITNQRRIIDDYCVKNDITLIGEFIDDGWSGGNFDRPGFQQMMRELQKGTANTVITKDLSRLGRDMRESSYYAEQFFPENGIRYIAIADNFDTEHDNVMAPFQFAMNEVYLRDGSRKIKDVLKSKRECGLYCACPPFGYKKDNNDNNLLIPDENTAPIVQRIFERAASGDSSRKIAIDLNEDGIIPPLKYRVLYRDNFGEKGASRASDFWNHTTVKRILKNEVYLGHTVLGKTKKVSVKSKKKVNVKKEDWAITKNTHEPLISENTFQMAQLCLGRHTTNYQKYDKVRKSIFSGVIYCAKCGHALCSCGSVYKGEREKYWYLSCTQKRKGVLNPCTGVRIRYEDIMELIRQELNSFLKLDDNEINQLVEDVIQSISCEESRNSKKTQLEKSKERLQVIDRIISKLYVDNANGRISEERFYSMLQELEKESEGLKKLIEEINADNEVEKTQENLIRFFNLAKEYTHIDTLTRDILLTFVDRIEVGEKVFPAGVIRNTHRTQPFYQEIRIYYKFIGNMGITSNNDIRSFNM